LSVAETQRVVQGLPAQLDAQSVLLTALIRSLEPGHRNAGTPIVLEGHGREPFDDRLDVSRTVGWFTALKPVTLELAGETFVEQARGIRTQVRAVAGQGSTLGNRAPRIAFNYLGAFENAEAAPLFTVEGEAPGVSIDPALERSSSLDVLCVVLGGRLRMAFTYSEAQFDRATVEGVASRMHTELLVASTAWEPESNQRAQRPKRFAGVSADDLARIMGDLE
jgi:non-ribosomal peptide synthase protein (TIGR01720 family)